MKKIYILLLISISTLFGQTDFWNHYYFTQNIRQIIESSDGMIYVITDSALIRSSDHYQNWDVLFEFEHPLDSYHLFGIYMNYSSQDTIKLVSRYRTYNPSSETIKLSTDNGTNWNLIDYPGGYSKSIAINSIGDIYLLSDTLYKSADDGLSWNPINIPTDDYELGYVLIIDNSDNIYITRYKRFWIWDPSGFPIFTWLEEKLFRSSNNGQNWEYLFYVWDEQGIKRMYHVPQNNILSGYIDRNLTHHYGNGYNRDLPLNDVNWAIFENNIIKYTSSSTEGISFTSNNGLTWSTENSGLPNLHTYSLLRDSLGYLYTGTDNGIFKSNFTSYSFSPVTNYQFEDTRLGDTTYNQITLNNPYPFDLIIDSLVCTTDNFFVSTSTSPIIPPNGTAIIDIGFKPEELGGFVDHLNLYAGNICGRIKLTAASPLPTLLELQAPSFGTVSIGDTTLSVLVYTSQSLNKITIDTLHLKQEKDFFLENIQFPVELEASDTIDFRIFFSPKVVGQRADTIVVLSKSTTPQLSNRIFGQGISPVVLQFGNFGNITINDTATSKLKLISKSENTITIDSIYLKYNTVFQMESLNFPVEILPTDTFSVNVFFTPLTIGQSVDTIVVVIENRNFQAVRRILGQGVNASDTEDENTLFKEFQLSNNYPNPFNPTTTIEYQVPKRSMVKISVFNLVGEETAVLVNEEKEQGKYQLEFNGKNLSSGVYFYKMQAENFISTKKFILIK